MILLTGANGNTGRAVLQALAAKGIPVRVFVRKSEQVEALRALGAHEAYVGDLLDPASLVQACQGIQGIYHICPVAKTEEEAIGLQLIKAAREAGVGHFVYHSVLHPQLRALPHHQGKLRVEEHLIESGLPFTILQPCAYMQNLEEAWATILKTGFYTVPYGKETRMSLLDLTDLAEAVSHIVDEADHFYATYELVGPAPITPNEMARVLSDRIGREIQVRSIAPEDWGQQMRRIGMRESQIEILQRMFQHYDEHGFVGNPRALAGLLGRDPRDFAAYAHTLS